MMSKKVASAKVVVKTGGYPPQRHFSYPTRNARLKLSLDLGCQEMSRDGNSVSGPTRYDTPRKSRSSPSKLRRSRLRAEALCTQLERDASVAQLEA